MSKIYSSPSQELFSNNDKENNYLDFQLLIDYKNSSEKKIKSLDQQNLPDRIKSIDTNIYNTNNINKSTTSEHHYDINSENALTVPEKCRRCRSNPPEIMCRECYPFIYFCSNCSNNLHSMESKKNHNVIPLEELNKEIFNEINSNNNMNISNINNNKSSNFNYMSSPESLSSSFNQLNMNLAGQKYTANYINDIKSIYETEKNNLIKKSFSLEKNLENTKQVYDDKISELQDKLTKLQNSKNLEFKILEEQKNYELNNILEEKQNKIDILIKRNEELNQFNEDLIKKISEYKEILNNSKLKTVDIIERQKDEIEQLKKDKNDLIKYYEKKINSMNNTYNEEKNNLIKVYEEQIKKINFDYNNNKEKMKSILSQREKDIQEIINSHRSTINEITKEADDIKNKNRIKNQEYDMLMNTINEQRSEIDDLKNQINMENQKYINELNDKKMLQKKVDELSSIIENMKNKNTYLNRLTRGKLNK